MQANKQLYIDNEALCVLSIAKEGLLYPIVGLMNEAQMNEVNQSGMYKGQSYPCPFLLTPSGKKNQEVLRSVKKGEKIDFITHGAKVGHIITDSVFEIDRQERITKITGGDIGAQNIRNIESRIGNICISGEYEIYDNYISSYKQRLEEKIQILNAKKITAVMMNVAPLHRVHEKIIRESISSCDLLVVFLIKPYRNDLVPYDLRLSCLEFLINNYLLKEKIIIIPLDDTYLYAGQNKMIASAIVARNFGCTKLLVGENNNGLSTYYLNNEVRSIFNSLKGIDLEVEILPEYVYCDICRTIVSVHTCPHGHHHHISYNSESFIEFFRLGLLPPAMFVRKQISSIMLSYLFPNRFKNLDRLYYDIMPGGGIVQNSGEEEFYLKLMELYQTTSLN